MDRRILLVNTERVDVLRTTLPTSKPLDGNRRRPQRSHTGTSSGRWSLRRGVGEHKERETRLKEEADNADVEERPDDLPDDVPAKGDDHDQREINNNRYYYYWQWRDGEKIRSQYQGPVNPDE